MKAAGVSCFCSHFVFTFQYGWIMKVIHSDKLTQQLQFTFQYGWIMKHRRIQHSNDRRTIYIPVWLDYEESSDNIVKPIRQIYIPVWLDYEA